MQIYADKLCILYKYGFAQSQPASAKLQNVFKELALRSRKV